MPHSNAMWFSWPLLMLEVLSEAWLLACSDPICTLLREVTSALSFVLSSVLVVTDDRICCCQPQDRTQMHTLHKERWCSDHKLVWLSGGYSCWQKSLTTRAFMFHLPPVFIIPFSTVCFDIRILCWQGLLTPWLKFRLLNNPAVILWIHLFFGATTLRGPGPPHLWGF
jgi:hypothetical protein